MAHTSSDYRPNQPEHNARTYLELLKSRERELGVHDRRQLLEITDSGAQLQTRDDLADFILDSDELHKLSRRDALIAAGALWRLVPPVAYEG